MASLSRHHLCFHLLAVISLWRTIPCASVKDVSKEKQGCSFPTFLQESCSKSSKTCRHWSQGKRSAYDENYYALYESVYQNNEPRGEYTWSFNEGKATIIEGSHPSKIASEFYCWKKLAAHVFIISSKNVTNETDSNVKYSCVKFRRRGRNVIEVEQSLWKDNHTSLDSCKTNELVINESPLILTSLEELPDCPSELRGGFQITKVYDALTGEQCLSDSGLGTFESDCMGKEGLLINLQEQQNCSITNRQLIGPVSFHLALSCYSTPWNEGHYTYFIVKSRTVMRNPFTRSDFLCARFQRARNESSEEFTLQLYDQPICFRNSTANSKSLIVHLRRRENIEETDRPPSEITKTECSFPDKFQGIWKEISLHNGIQNVVINKTTIEIPPYGAFHCKQQYIFQHQAPHLCSSLVTGKWPGTGRAKFFIDDYLLLSNFTNGCRPRLTRFGVTEIVDGNVLVYRLSQSQTILNSHEHYYFNYVLRLFCSSWLPYIKDPFPIWGRNIDKIIMKPTSIARTSRCALPPLTRGVYYFKSVNADQSECSGPRSRVQFACEKSFAFEVKYDPSCHKPDVSFNCIGLAWKFGEFSLVQDVQTKNISCMWYDEINKQLFRLNSPQCSDIDWGRKRPGDEVNYAEKFVIEYYSKCPIISDERKIDFPIVISKRRNASRNPNIASLLIVVVYIITVIMY